MMRPRRVRPADHAEHAPPARGSAGPADAAREAELADERLADLLVELVGGVLRDRIDPQDPAHAPYFDWLAREAYEAQTPEERARTAREADEFARDMMRRLRDMDARDAAGADPWAQARSVRRETDEPRACVPQGAARGADAVREAARAGYVPRFALSVAAGVGRELWDEPADAWLEVPAGVPPGMHVALTVRGDSMRPLLHDGDTLLVRVGTEVGPGDVIVARRPEHGYVVKRVAAIAADTMRLASDNPAYDDFTLPRDPALLVGVVVLRWCTHGSAAA